jgi:hypothetical protein
LAPCVDILREPLRQPFEVIVIEFGDRVEDAPGFAKVTVRLGHVAEECGEPGTISIVIDGEDEITDACEGGGVLVHGDFFPIGGRVPYGATSKTS